MAVTEGIWIEFSTNLFSESLQEQWHSVLEEENLISDAADGGKHGWKPTEMKNLPVGAGLLEAIL